MSQPSRTTRRLTATPKDIAQAAEILRNGGTVAFPTETVYGLGANALDTNAVAAIFAAKQRPNWDPIIVHISDRAMLDQVAIVPPQAEPLIAAFWPGPLTLLLPRTSHVPDNVTADRPLVGVRMPSHPVALSLIEATGLPIAAPSANRFGRTSPTTAQHVIEDLDHRIDAVLDGGPTTVGVESTVIGLNTTPGQPAIIVYRPGAITAAMLEPITGPIALYQPPQQLSPEPQSLPSPGTGIRHYAPRARLVLVNTESGLNNHLVQLIADKEKVGVMLPQNWTIHHRHAKVFHWNSFDDNNALAHSLFAGLRDLDSRGVTVILCPLPAGDGLGHAIRDRLEKAAKSK
jgi:L-threonylcarbamoyladenylate synthase